MDEDDSGEISREEFNKAMTSNEEVIAAITALGLEEEKDLFDSLDADSSGSLEFDEFFEGVMLILKGQEPALAKDMVATYLRASSLYKKHEQLESDFAEYRAEEVAFQKSTRDALARIQHLTEMAAAQAGGIEV